MNTACLDVGLSHHAPELLYIFASYRHTTVEAVARVPKGLHFSIQIVVYATAIYLQHLCGVGDGISPIIMYLRNCGGHGLNFICRYPNSCATFGRCMCDTYTTLLYLSYL
jgi:hypothetical protein